MTNIIVVGVGGQGIMTLVELIASAGLESGISVRAHTQASLTQLAGPVICHVRLGECYSSKVPLGQADYVIALELSESLRTIPFVKDGTLALVSRQKVVPSVVKVKGLKYPQEEEIAQIFAKSGARLGLLSFVSSSSDSISVGANIAMLGAFIANSKLLERSVVEGVIKKRFSSGARENLNLFAKGYETRFTEFVPSGLEGAPLAR